MAFANFEAEPVAGFDEGDVKRLLLDAGIVRHAGKTASTTNNAKRVIELRREFGRWVLTCGRWNLAPQAVHCSSRIGGESHADLTSLASAPLSKDLEKRG